VSSLAENIPKRKREGEDEDEWAPGVASEEDGENERGADRWVSPGEAEERYDSVYNRNQQLCRP